jgi:hypothetical protein
MSGRSSTRHEPRSAREDCKAMDAFALEFICYGLGFHHHICFEGVEIPLVKCFLGQGGAHGRVGAN